MIEIIKIQCLDKRDAERKEREYIDNLKPILNKNIPFREVEENKKYQKEYYINNIEEIKNYYKEYTKSYYIDNIDKKKEYKIQNADKIKEYHKKYNKEYYNKIKLSKINNIEAVLLVDNIE